MVEHPCLSAKALNFNQSDRSSISAENPGVKKGIQPKSLQKNPNLTVGRVWALDWGSALHCILNAGEIFKMVNFITLVYLQTQYRFFFVFCFDCIIHTLH